MPLASGFYVHGQMLDGYLNICKVCTKKRVHRHRAKNLEKVQEYDRLRGALPHRVKAREEYQETPAYTEAQVKSHRKYREKYPEKYKAVMALGTAIRSGRVKRKPCEKCGKRKTHGHHADYSKPLEVQWLCGFHHAEVHNFHRGPRNKKEKNGN